MRQPQRWTANPGEIEIDRAELFAGANNKPVTQFCWRKGGLASASVTLNDADRPLRMPGPWMSLLRCPTCRTELVVHGDEMRCASSHLWPIVQGVPVFSDAGRDVEVRPDDHMSNQPTESLYRDFDPTLGPFLHLGAGASHPALPNALELETAIFVHTHVVGDVHHLPFADNSLGGVLAQNVFEHLADPDRAAAEMHRCLAPGGRVAIHTAFLQPLHADPYHFYNTTEVGLRRWFQKYDIEVVDVPWNFNPVFAFSWMASELLHGAPTSDKALFENATLAQLSALWRDPGSRSDPLFEAFHRLPSPLQRILAAGFELRARKR